MGGEFRSEVAGRRRRGTDLFFVVSLTCCFILKEKRNFL